VCPGSGIVTSVRGRRLITFALFVATFLVALDNSIIATAMPTVIGQIGGIHLYAWVFSAYLLASTVTVPIYGKLADLYGRKPVYLAATALFLAGSLLCGQAQTMEQLVLFRLIQGLGAGGVLPVTQTIVGDVYPLAERARIVGLFSAVWGISALLGPAIGGFLTEQVSWRFVFYVNLPLCLLSMTLIWLFLHESVEHRRHSIDVLGALSLSGSASALLVALQSSGNPGLQAALYVVAFGLLAVFVWQERRAPEPMVPLGLFTRRVLAVSTLVALLMGVVMFGQTSFMPPFVQGVMGATPTVSGLVLASMSIAWSAATPVGGRLLLRLGYRIPCMLGCVLLTLGFLMLTQVPADAELWVPAAIACVIGAGFGLVSVVTILAAQAAVGWDQRGVVTSANQFARNIGGTVGVPIAGAFFAAYVASAAAAGLDPNSVLAPDMRSVLSQPDLAFLQSELSDALRAVYVLFAVMGGLATLVSAFLPGGPPTQAAETPVVTVASAAGR
jgi:EmrB/QacA subfamily drug resistance transporter